MTESLVTISGLSYRPNEDAETDILHKVNLSIAAGERLAIIGANGSGKTTLLRLLTGDQTMKGKTDGRIAMCEPLMRRPGAIGFVRQRPALFPWLSVKQNIAFSTSLKASPSDAERQGIDEHMERFGCMGLSRKYPAHLSGGESQRVALAQALYPCPTLLLMDEPFSAMDVPAKATMVDCLRELWHEHGFAVLLVCHDFRDVLRLADRILVLGRNAQGSHITMQFSVKPEQREDAPYIKDMLYAMSEATNNLSTAK